MRTRNPRVNKPELARAIPLFRDLAEEQLADIAAVIEVRHVKKGVCIMKYSEQAHFVMFVSCGELRVKHSDGSGKEFVVDLLRPGDIFGELAIITKAPRTADIEAVKDSVVLVLSEQDFEQYVLDNNALLRKLLFELASRLRGTTKRIKELALCDVYRRLARVLLSLAERRGKDTLGLIPCLPTHKELAALTGTSREMVTRGLKELEAGGHICIEGKAVTICSLPE